MEGLNIVYMVVEDTDWDHSNHSRWKSRPSGHKHLRDRGLVITEEKNKYIKKQNKRVSHQIRPLYVFFKKIQLTINCTSCLHWAQYSLSHY